MHHKTRDSTIKKYSDQTPDFTGVLWQKIKSENPDFTDDDLHTIIEGIRGLKETPKIKTMIEQLSDMPKAEMLRYDLLKGFLTVMKQKKIPGTGQTQVTEVRFEISDPKPVQSQSMPAAQAEFFNQNRFTARYQPSQLYFPAGQKLDYWWKYNEDTEVFDFIVKELATA